MNDEVSLYTKKKLILIFLIFILAVINFIITRQASYGLSNQVSLGSHSLSIFIQLPFLFLNYLIFLELKMKKFFLFILPIIFSLPSFLVLSEYFNVKIIFFEADDNYRFDKLAKFFLMHKNITINDIDSYIIHKVQPGYSYYLSILLLFFDEQSVLTQLISVLICFKLITLFLNFIDNSNIRILEKYFIFYLVLSSSLFLSKTILFSMSEWLAISLISTIPIIILKKNFKLLFSIVALITIIRTNYILINIFFILLVYKKINDKKDLFFFFIPFIFVFSHNFLVYEDFSFFITSNKTFIPLNTDLNSFAEMFNYSLDHILSYFSLSPNTSLYTPISLKSSTFVMSIMTLPFFAIYYLYNFFTANLKYKIILFLLFFFSAGVTFFYGWGYYPRFHITHYFICLVYFIAIKNIYNNQLLK